MHAVEAGAAAMQALQGIVERARRLDRRIVLSEGEDDRVVAAAISAAAAGLARIDLIGRTEVVHARVSAAGGRPGMFVVHDPGRSALAERFAQTLFELRRHRGLSLEDAARGVRQPLHFAALMVRSGLADGTVGGAYFTTAETVRAALEIIGPARPNGFVSSFFLMLLGCSHPHRREPLLFSDCALAVEPSATQLADIAIASAESYRRLVGGTPHVAMLSFSTAGSARHQAVTKVVEATQLVRARAPGLSVDGELQFDAALLPEVAARKGCRSAVAGHANVFIFPNLDSGNIAYKIAERLGGAVAIGPVLQGLAAPANDVSRGCAAQDLLNMIALTAVQSAPPAARTG